MSTQPVAHYTMEQYLEMERATDRRHEYFGGQVFEMDAVTPNHARITRYVLGALDRQLPGESGCEAFGSNLGVFIAARSVMTYPDVVVTCGPVRFHDKKKDVITDATVLIEVLSPSTADYDRGEKFRNYRSLPSFREYLLFAQDAIRAEHHVRQSDGSWLFREYTSGEDCLELKSIGCRLSLDAVYRRIDFS